MARSKTNTALADEAKADLLKLLKPGDTFSIVGSDGSDMTLICTPRLTTVAQPAYQIGMKAAEMLFAELEGEVLQESRVTLDFELKVRQSTR